MKSDADWIGLVVLYLSLVAVALVSLMLRGARAQAHIRAIREQGRTLFWRGFAVTITAALLILLLGALNESLKKAGDTRASQLVGLIAAVIVLAYLLLALLGFGSVAVVVGDSVAQLFGWRDLSAGWCSVLGCAIIPLVVWIPLFGWALGVYWLSLAIGGLWSQSQIAPDST